MEPIPNRQDSEIQRKNFRNVQIDAIGVSISNVAAPYLPVFLTRLGASNFQVGLLSSMPGMTGLVLAILVGRFLQNRKNIVPWLSIPRLLFIACFALTGLAAIFLPKDSLITSTLIIWAFATLPATIVGVSFSVVMNAVAGPGGRYTLLGRRWAIFGLVGALVTFIVTSLIDRVAFPLNFGILFLALSSGGVISYIFSSRIKIPEQPIPPLAARTSISATIKNYLALLRGAPAFVSFSSKQFVYLSALALSAPILPLFYVRSLGATDSQIGTINLSTTLFLLAGYFFWPWISKKRGGRAILLAASFGMIFHPALTAGTGNVNLIYLYSALAGFCQAGLDLVFFDELMKTVPIEYSPIFISIAQSIQYISAIIAPTLGAFLADYFGLGGALWLSAGLRLAGFLLFLKPDTRKH